MSITIRVIDFETTGIPTKDDPHAIVEIGQSFEPDVLFTARYWLERSRRR